MTSSLELNSNHCKIFYGEYKDFREQLDYTYFTNVTKERQLFQDNLIRNYLKGYQSYKQPWILFTWGTYGSGKTHTLKTFDKSMFDLQNFFHIDPDKVKNDLPEAKQFSLENKVTACGRLHKESVMICMLLEYIALDKKIAIIVDGSLKDGEWYKQHFKKVGEMDYKIAIIKVVADLDVIQKRCEQRGKDTERIIDKNLVLKVYKETLSSFQILKDLADIVVEVENNDFPKISSIKLNNCER